MSKDIVPPVIQDSEETPPDDVSDVDAGEDSTPSKDAEPVASPTQEAIAKLDEHDDAAEAVTKPEIKRPSLGVHDPMPDWARDATAPKIELRGPNGADGGRIEELDTLELPPQSDNSALDMTLAQIPGAGDLADSTREIPILKDEELWFIYPEKPPSIAVGTELTVDDTIVHVLGCLSSHNYERRYRVSVEGHAKTLLLKQGASKADFVRYDVEAKMLIDIHETGNVKGLPKVHALSVEDECQYIVCDMPVGTEFSKILNTANRSLELGKLITILIQLVEALEHIHQAGYVVTSLRPASISVGAAPEHRVMLHDFLNITQTVDHPPYALASPYTAPEVADRSPADEGMDLFSIGAMLHKIVTQREIPSHRPGRIFVSEDVRTQVPVIFQILTRTLSSPTDRFFDLRDLSSALRQLTREIRPQLHIDTSMRSSTGINPMRIVNQDSAGYQEYKTAHRTQLNHVGFYAVADGMGGHEDGDRASELAVSGALQKFREFTTRLTIPEWREGCSELCKEIASAGSRNLVDTIRLEGTPKKMGTTFTSILLVDTMIALAHIGDSRAILVRDGEMINLSEDHSLVGMMVKTGQMTPEQAERAEEKNILMRSMGADHIIRPNLFDGLDVTMKQTTLNLKNDDRIVLVSDGVWGLMPKNVMADVINRNTDSRELADSLCVEAIRRGGLDNVIVVVLHIQLTLPPFMQGLYAMPRA